MAAPRAACPAPLRGDADIRNLLIDVSGTPFAYLTATNGELVRTGTSELQNNILGLGRQDSTSYTRTPEGAVLSQRGPSSTEYYLRDRLDSTIGLISGTSIVRDYTYDPDGNADSPQQTGPTADIRFAGGHLGNGLYHFGARYYDPQFGRWTQPDPLQQPNDLRQANRYTYASCDPVNVVDPTGLYSFWEGVADVAAVLGVAEGVAVTGINAYATGACVVALMPTGPGVLACAVPALMTAFSAYGTYLVGDKAVQAVGD